MAGSLLKKITLLLLITTIVALVGFLALPHIVDRVFLPSLLAKTPFSFSRATISRITPYLVEGSVEVKDGSNPVISIPRFQMRFTPKSLLKKKISSLVLDHATLHFYERDGRLVLPGFIPQANAKKSATQDTLFLLPLGVKALILDQCRLVVHVPDKPSLYLGVNGQFFPTFNASGDEHRLDALNGSFFFSDDLSAAVSLSASVRDGGISAQLAIDNGSLSLPYELFGNQIMLPAFTSLSANLDLLLDAQSFSLKRYELDGTIAGLRYHTDTFALSGGSDGDNLNFVLSGAPGSHRYQVSRVILESPVYAEVDIEGDLRYRDGETKSSGSATAVWLPDGDEASGKLPLAVHYLGQWSGSEDGSLFLEGGSQPGQFEQPLTLPGDWLISGLESLKFSSTLEFGKEHLRAALEVKNGPLELHRDTHRLVASGLEAKASLNRTAAREDSRLEASLAEVGLPEKHLVIKNLAVDLPLIVQSEVSSSAEGRVTLAAVELDEEHLFSMAADLTRYGPDYRTTGSIELLNSPDLSIPFKGELAWKSRRAALSWNLNTTSLGPGDLPSFLSLPYDLDFSGLLEAEGGITYDSGISGWANAAITDAHLVLSDTNISVDGLDCAIEFPELPRLQSNPSQRCSARAIDISTLHFSDASFVFRLENPDSLFIEKSRLGWCGGTLESGSLRLSTQISEIDTTFYCSRVGLAELLDQFGFKGTEGEGALNGKLPIRLSRERIDFEDGFLFSTPGTGGIVRFTDTDLLRQGVGKVSEAGFLNYTLQSLEDFTYNWTRLSFDSAEDDLLLTLELDGKPSTALPFKFDTKGMLVESGQGEGLQYPIRLDVNFRVPLVDLFQLGQSINSIIGSGQ